jgi:hypothetical protein
VWGEKAGERGRGRENERRRRGRKRGEDVREEGSEGRRGENVVGR